MVVSDTPCTPVNYSARTIFDILFNYIFQFYNYHNLFRTDSSIHFVAKLPSQCKLLSVGIIQWGYGVCSCCCMRTNISKMLENKAVRHWPCLDMDDGRSGAVWTYTCFSADNIRTGKIIICVTNRKSVKTKVVPPALNGWYMVLVLLQFSVCA